jgi:aspartate ammonia-lyase
MIKDFRTESDSLGSITVPATALYGAQTRRALENFQISGRSLHSSLVRATIRVKAAAADANKKCGALSLGQSQLIAEAAEKLLALSEAELLTHFPIDAYQAGAGTSQNMNANEVLANLAGELDGQPLGTYKTIHPNDHVNRSQSTNDTFPTAMRLALLEDSREWVRQLLLLAKSFETKAQAWKDIPKAGRTHLQDAVPMTLGQEFSGYADAIRRCANWIEQTRNELRSLGLGGSAAGTGLTVPPGFAQAAIEKLSELTGEKLRREQNLFESMQSQAPVSFYMGATRVAAIELTRICNDLRLLTSGPLTGLAEILLPAVQPGSSIMPGKVNPSILEMANQTWFSVLGYEQTVAHCMQAGQLELNVMMPMMAFSAIEATRIGTQAARTLRERCIDGLEPNRERLRRYFEATPQIATALSPVLGYEKAAKLVKIALERSVSVTDLVREQKLITEEQLQELLNVKTLTGSQNSTS